MQLNFLTQIESEKTAKTEDMSQIKEPDKLRARELNKTVYAVCLTENLMVKENIRQW